MTASPDSIQSVPQRQEFFFGRERSRLVATVQDSPHHVRVLLHAKIDEEAILHWGLCKTVGSVWRCPPKDARPAGSRVFDEQSLQTDFQVDADGESRVVIELPKPILWSNLSFVIYLPANHKWIKNGRYDFCLDLPRDRGGKPVPIDVAGTWLQTQGDELSDPDAAVRLKTYDLDSGEQLAVASTQTDAGIRMAFFCDATAPLILHWGLSERSRHQWIAPPSGMQPAGSEPFDKRAVRTPFTLTDDLCQLEIFFPQPPADGPGPQGLNFLLYQPEENLWHKVDNNDMHCSLFKSTAPSPVASDAAKEMVDIVVDAEVGKSSWTLMHRFHLCRDLLDNVGENEEMLSVAYVWLRYSAMRQLDWQRNYNTKPATLSHAQNQLTGLIAQLWKNHSSMRIWARRILGTLGRGGEAGQGQQIRDEILNIMHRHKIKEDRSLWMEQWHQKLHNNTTPDDIGICAAFIAFMEAGGDTEAYWRVLGEHGITRERLEGFDRPIQNEPEYFADKRDGLINDFWHYLSILKAVHGGEDLNLAFDRARRTLNGETRGPVEGAMQARGKEVHAVLGAMHDARKAIHHQLENSSDSNGILDLLYLDLALENVFRNTLEGEDGDSLSQENLTWRISITLEQIALSIHAPVFASCAAHWQKLLDTQLDAADWALHAKSVTDRMRVEIQQLTASTYASMQPLAEYMGKAFHVDDWVIPLFSEEVIRGEVCFVLSLLLRRLEPRLREQAGLGDWQVISPAEATGVVREVDALIDVQEEVFKEDTILLTPHVDGDEEVPEGVVAVLTTDSPDLVSHVAVRARNMKVLLAICYEPSHLTALKENANTRMTLQVSPGGDVEWSEAQGSAAASPAREHATMTIAPRSFSSWCVTPDAFDREILGGKSNNLQHLRGAIPEWMQLPASLAIPFGAFEKAMEDPANASVRLVYEERLRKAEKRPSEGLPLVREAVETMIPPPGLEDAVTQKWNEAGLPACSWDTAWPTIRKVWASKWNERAYFSRRHLGIPHDALQMAVLIQQVVEAEYAFVIHSVNPINGRADEIFIEAVCGLGETLVGNYPGRALGAIVGKEDNSIRLISYPGKGEGLFGRGVIFRSDSNGEDLEGFAGAGLYDSFLAEPPVSRLIDYVDEPLMWDAGARDDFLHKAAEIARVVESACGGVAQDIEGACSKGEWYVVQTRPQVGLDET